MNRIFLSYVFVIAVWSTTALTVKWSGEEIGFLLGVMTRMLLATTISIAIVAVWKRSLLPFDENSRKVYLAIGIPLYTSMLCTYWGAQFVTSGLIAILFGLTPLVSGIIAHYWINERNFAGKRLVGMVLGLTGLIVIFYHRLEFGANAHWGIVAILFGVIFQSLGMVWIKRANHHLSILQANTGGLFVASVLYTITWLVIDRHIPAQISVRTWSSIAYLALVGSVLVGFAYFYLLRHLDTGKVAMITVVTPVTGLLVGHWFNQEPINNSAIIGTILVMSGLLFYLAPALTGRFVRNH